MDRNAIFGLAHPGARKRSFLEGHGAEVSEFWGPPGARVSETSKVSIQEAAKGVWVPAERNVGLSKTFPGS